LPFAALRRRESQYLVESKPLHSAVSATVYAELKKISDKERNGSIEIAAFGDPRYPNARGGQEADRSNDAELRSVFAYGWNPSRLRFSREEVNTIASLYPGRSYAYLDAEATEDRAKSLCAQTRYLHFATHGLLDERFPLNSALVLAIPEKPSSGEGNGLLQAWEIFEQVRCNAELVVLSSCRSALGQELGSEGLVGLTRALHYAGARSVLGSLWNIDDRRTSQLMKSFYEHLRKGVSKDQALRYAQIDLIRSPNAARPFFWAAFSLSGDWR
jgi:CHAT domain-containing protein